MEKIYPSGLQHHVGREMKLVPVNSGVIYLSGILRRRNSSFYLEYFQDEKRRAYTLRKGDGIHTGDMKRFIGWVG